VRPVGEESLEPLSCFRRRVGARDPDRVEAVLARGLLECVFQLQEIA